MPKKLLLLPVKSSTLVKLEGEAGKTRSVLLPGVGAVPPTQFAPLDQFLLVGEAPDHVKTVIAIASPDRASMSRHSTNPHKGSRNLPFGPQRICNRTKRLLQPESFGCSLFLTRLRTEISAGFLIKQFSL